MDVEDIKIQELEGEEEDLVGMEEMDMEMVVVEGEVMVAMVEEEDVLDHLQHIAVEGEEDMVKEQMEEIMVVEGEVIFLVEGIIMEGEEDMVMVEMVIVIQVQVVVMGLEVVEE